MENADIKEIEQFLKCSLEEDGEKLKIKKPWCDETVNIEIENNAENINLLKNIKLDPRLSAIYHFKEHKIEFIFAGVDDTSYFLNYKTEFVYKGQIFKTFYESPSDILLLLAKGLTESEAGNTNLRNLALVKDAVEKKAQNVKVVSYYITTDKFPEDFVSIAKHINLYMHFYDKKAPHIIFHDTIDGSRIEYGKSVIPQKISMTNIEDIILDLLYTVNCTQNIRLKYLLTYQVLEYYAYYYLDADQKSSIESVIRNPDFLDKSSYYSNVLIDKIRDYANTDDKSRLKKLVTHYINLEDIVDEIKTHLPKLMSDIEFKGGFVLPAMTSFNEKDAKDNFSRFEKQHETKQRAILGELVDKCDKIRNVIVHVREHRENKVIYPTPSNHEKLVPYLIILQKIAELIAMRHH